MNTIPTAEEFIQQGFSNPPYIDINDLQFKGSRVKELVEQYAILKAKFYVEAALKAAAENTNCDIIWSDDGNTDSVFAEIDKDSILNAYPLTNII